MVKTEVATNTPHLSPPPPVGQRDGTQATGALEVYIILSQLYSFASGVYMCIVVLISGYPEPTYPYSE